MHKATDIWSKGMSPWRLIPRLLSLWSIFKSTHTAKFMGPTWGPPGSCRPQMGPMLAPWTLLSGKSLQLTWISGTCSCYDPWWRHQVETFSALPALCAGNSPVTGEFPAQRPMGQSFDVFFDLRLNKQLSKQSRGWWFETPWRSLWRHFNAWWPYCPHARPWPHTIDLHPITTPASWPTHLVDIYNSSHPRKNSKLIHSGLDTHAWPATTGHISKAATVYWIYSNI